MLRQAIEHTGQAPAALTADAGYWQPGVEDESRALGTEAYVAMRRQKHHEETSAPAAGPPTRGADPRARMQHKLKTREGRAIYALRKSTVEPVFGQIKEPRSFRRFSMRGGKAAGAERDLVCLTHNLLKLFRHGSLPVAAAS